MDWKIAKDKIADNAVTSLSTIGTKKRKRKKTIYVFMPTFTYSGGLLFSHSKSEIIDYRFLGTLTQFETELRKGLKTGDIDYSYSE